jgi:hypothetical protein
MEQIHSKIISDYIKIKDSIKEKGILAYQSSLLHATLTALNHSSNPDCIFEKIHEYGERLHKSGSLLDLLTTPITEFTSAIKFAFSSCLLRAGDTPEDFLKEHDRVKELFRTYGLRKGHIQESIAILFLRIGNNLEPITGEHIHRFKKIYEEMKKHHWWLTGPDDFPACALLSSTEQHVTEVGNRIEKIYQLLAKEGFPKRDPLQTVSNLLYFLPMSENETAQRFIDLTKAFQQLDVSIWQTDYLHLNLLCFLNTPVQEIAKKVVSNRDIIKEISSWDSFENSFSIATIITYLELEDPQDRSRAQPGVNILELNMLQTILQIITATQTATIAAVT